MLTKIAHLPLRSVRYLEAGSGRPLVLLHAFPLSADQWLPQLQRPPAGWRVVAPDLRGFRGDGPAFEDVGLDAVTMETYAADVLEIMSHLDMPRAAIGGVSMGGYVAMAILRRAPDRVAGLVLACTRATADTVEGRAKRDALIAVARAEGARAIAERMVPTLLGETTRREQPDLAEAIARAIALNPPETIVAALEAMKSRPDSTALLETVRVPTVIVHGEEDAIIAPAEAEDMQRRIGGSTLVVLPRAGHLANLEAPLAFTRALETLGAGVAGASMARTSGED